MAAGLINYKDGKDAMTRAIERAVAETIRDLECYLSTLGIIAAVCPLLGLLGTVIGMIQVFGDIMFGVSAISSNLAGGISSALITIVINADEMPPAKLDEIADTPNIISPNT